MRKVKNKNTVVQKLIEISSVIVLDLLIDNFSESGLNLFFKKVDIKIYHEKLYKISRNIINGDNEFFEILKNHNNTYIKNNGYSEMSIKKLKIEFEKDLVKSIAGTGIAPEQMILYILTTNERKKDYNFFIEEYKKDLSKENEYTKSFEKLPKLNELLRGSRMELEFQEKIDSKFYKNLSDETIDKLIERYQVERIGKYNVKVSIGFLEFLDHITSDIFFKLELFENYYGILHGNFLKVNAYFKEIEKEHNEFLDIKEDFKNEVSKNKNINLENINLRNKIKDLESIIDNNLISTQKKEINYLHSRIEKLEREIKDIEQDEALEILNDVKLEEIENKAQRISLSNKKIAVLGGTYNSRQKEEIEEIIVNKNSEISFVPANRIFRNGDKIKNSDVVIFDTSYNSHSAFYKVKSICDSIVFVNSTKELIELIK